MKIFKIKTSVRSDMYVEWGRKRKEKVREIMKIYITHISSGPLTSSNTKGVIFKIKTREKIVILA